MESTARAYGHGIGEGVAWEGGGGRREHRVNAEDSLSGCMEDPVTEGEGGEVADVC